MSVVNSQLLKIASLMLSAGLLCVSLSAHGKVYRYVTEDGTVIYGDRAPNTADDKGHQIMSKQGVVLKDVLSREEQREKRKEEKEAALAKVHDRALLATFTSEDDLSRTRDDRIGMIDGLIGRLDDRIRILSERMAVIEKRIVEQEKLHGVDNAPESLYTEQRSVQRNIENAWALIDTKAAERSKVVEKFDVDLKRYRELKNDANRY